MTDSGQQHDAAAINWQPLSRRFLLKSLVSEVLVVGGVVIVAPTALAVMGLAQTVPLAAWALAPLYLIVQLVLLPPAIRRAGYALRDDDLQFRKGLIVHRRRVVPLCRVQHVETARGPLERLFGLSTIKLYTAAAGGGSDLTIQGLDDATAIQLRHFILERVRGESAADE